jgi:hypothetical protein
MCWVSCSGGCKGLVLIDKNAGIMIAVSNEESYQTRSWSMEEFFSLFGNEKSSTQ